MSTATVMRKTFRRAVVDNARGDNRRRIEIRNVPRTALPTDIRRLCAKAKIENIASIDVDYRRFVPTGSAWVTLTTPAFVRSVMQSLHGSLVAGHEVSTHQAENEVEDLPPRTRGARGRAEAAERGVITGDGPSGGVTSGGSSAVLYGLPGKMTPEAAGYFLNNFKLAGASPDSKDIVKLNQANNVALTAKFFIRLASSAEAHRLVRKLHETYYEPEIFDKRYRVRARVVY